MIRSSKQLIYFYKFIGEGLGIMFIDTSFKDYNERFGGFTIGSINQFINVELGDVIGTLIPQFSEFDIFNYTCEDLEGCFNDVKVTDLSKIIKRSNTLLLIDILRLKRDWINTASVDESSDIAGQARFLYSLLSSHENSTVIFFNKMNYLSGKPICPSGGLLVSRIISKSLYVEDGIVNFNTHYTY